MADESFREIQLSGKQLIALFMAAAVVLIGTFLSGVLVGRGVRSQQEPPIAADAAQAPGAAVDPTTSTTALQAPPQAEPPPQADEVPPGPARGEAKPAQTAVVAAASAGAAAGAKPADAKPKEIQAAAAAPGRSETAGTGYFVKVVAYRTTAEADRMAARLSAKGYAAYVTPVTGKGASLYSVRVGTFATRQDAEAAKRRLEQEEQLKPSIAR
jgi:cell division septation protein DedD